MNFIFNGIRSDEFNIKVVKSNHLSLPAKRIESVEIQGRTGNLIIDDGSRKNLIINIECEIKCQYSELQNLSNKLGMWLQDPVGYKVLEFEDGKKFNAICTNQIDLTEVAYNFNEFVLKFDATEVKP